MAAGLGFKDFTTGEVLTAADVDGYLMQGIWVFANSTARDAAVTSPQEGNFAFLKDTNTTTYYTGSAWTNLDTTGMVNPMTTTGDTIYSSSGSTPARLGIGTAGQVLTVNSGATAPEWATASSGGMTLISTTTLTGASIALSSIPSTYNNLQLVIRDYHPSTNTIFNIRFNNDSGSNYCWEKSRNTATSNSTATDTTLIAISDAIDAQTTTSFNSTLIMNLYDYASAQDHNFEILANYRSAVSSNIFININGFHNPGTAAAISSIEIFTSAGTMSGGTALLYGVK